ncbi:hypothetical protein [Fontivita pretiosa]|jgi:hypothetical protein|uniref:hypothetical protein n=1 Tax=Fontivita pretiosa TaxID=2989684 RepID=UPI003D17FD65
MKRKWLAGLLLGAVPAMPLLAGGCAAEGEPPFALTGQPVSREQAREQARWTDDKGHYRADWKSGINRPPGYPKPVAP